MVIKTVRFNQDLLVGTELDPRSSVGQGDRHMGEANIHLSKYDDLFLLLSFDYDGKRTTRQLIPWAAVATVLFEEEKVAPKSK